MKILCSYCSHPKRRDEDPLPAIERYRSPRLRAMWARALADGTPLYILSGELGLIAPHEPIPWYDHLLLPGEVPAMRPRVARRLMDLGVTAVEYHTAMTTVVPQVQAYLDLVRGACADAGATLAVVELPGDPD